MKLFLKLIFSLFIFATAEIFVATSSSGESSGSQGDHEREHQLHRSQHVKRTLRTTSATEVPLFYSPPEIEKRYECIPYQDYVSILDLKFENFTMEKLSVENYQLNCEKIDQHNVLYQKLIFTYAKGKNHLIWKEFEESRESLCGTRIPHTSRALKAKTGFKTYPKLTGKAVTEANFCNFHNQVRDQDSCGSCWAFSVIAVIEALLIRNKGGAACASEQMLVDCDKQNLGCNGGWPTDALTFIKKYGLSECKYSYANSENECKRRKFLRVVDPGKIEVVEEPLNGDEELLKRIVAAKGSVVVVIHISESIFAYASGVYIDDQCPKTMNDVNHAVVICGYGEDLLYGPYWVVRNSWSPYWGELGYVRIARGRNTCGIATVSAMYAEM